MGFLSDLANKVYPESGNPEDRKIETPSDQTNEEQDFASYIKRKVEEVRSSASRISHEGVWMTNIAYVLGFDSVYYDTRSRQYQPVGGPMMQPTRNRIRSNLILPAIQNKLARLCKNPPKYEVAPEDETIDSREEAHTALKVLTDLWERLNINEKRIDLFMWLQECGHSFMKPCWDDEAGKPIVDPVTGEFLGHEGDTRVDVVSAFEVFTDPLAKTLEESQWVVHAKVRKLDYFKKRYPERGHAVKAEGVWLLSLNYEMRINNMNNIGPNSSGVQAAAENTAIELAYYERPTAKHRKGRMGIVANGIVLEDEKELPIGEIPLVKFDDIKIAGKFYSECCTTHARPLQDQYNRLLQRRAKWSNTLLGGKWMAAKGHGLSQEALNDTTEVLEYNPVPNAGEPKAMQVPVIPQYAYVESDSIKSDLYAIYGLSEVSRGQLPSAGIPAVGMQLLVEQDETRIGIEVEQHEHAFAHLGSMLLKYEGRYRKSKRPIKQRGMGGDFNISYYDGNSLPRNPDVKVVRGSTIPTSRALNRQEIINAFQLGVLGSPQDPLTLQRVNGMLEFGDSNEIWKKYGIAKAQIARRIKMIEQGEVPKINKLDNHILAISELNDYRVSKEDSLSSEQSAILEKVIDEHAQFMVDLTHPELAAKRENTQSGLMPDGSDPQTAIQEQQQQQNAGLVASLIPLENSQGAPIHG